MPGAAPWDSREAAAGIFSNDPPSGRRRIVGRRDDVSHVQEVEKWPGRVIDAVEPEGSSRREERRDLTETGRGHRAVATHVLELVQGRHLGDERVFDRGDSEGFRRGGRQERERRIERLRGKSHIGPAHFDSSLGEKQQQGHERNRRRQARSVANEEEHDAQNRHGRHQREKNHRAAVLRDPVEAPAEPEKEDRQDEQRRTIPITSSKRPSPLSNRSRPKAAKQDTANAARKTMYSLMAISKKGSRQMASLTTASLAKAETERKPMITKV
jgi:hypothetical protein